MDRMPWDDDGEGWKPGKGGKPRKAKKKWLPWRDDKLAMRLLTEAKEIKENGVPKAHPEALAADKLLCRMTGTLEDILGWKDLPPSLRALVVTAMRHVSVAEGAAHLLGFGDAK